jgi:YfiH family protein
MPAVSDHPVLARRDAAGWWVPGWSRFGVLAALTDRRAPGPALLESFNPLATAEAEQVHGAGVAAVSAASTAGPVAGCDGLITASPRVALIVRTADCLPLFFVDPQRRAIGLAHVGWRGLSKRLPSRAVLALRDICGADPARMRVVIGPAIRACCYEVGPDVAALFAPGHVRVSRGRQLCDLPAVAREQLERAGVPRRQILDSGACTACEPDRWFSRRREGPQTGRMVSVIMLRA